MNFCHYLISILLIIGIYSAQAVNKGGIIAAIETLEDDNLTGNEYDKIEKTESIFESRPIEIDSANVQILDKISGKKYHTKLFLNKTEKFGSIEITLKRCFKNSPEDENEVYAYIEIKEQDKVIFSKWLFASAVSVNIFSHPVYDVRVEF